MRFGEIYRICKDNYDIIHFHYLKVVSSYKNCKGDNEFLNRILYEYKDEFIENRDINIELDKNLTQFDLEKQEKDLIEIFNRSLKNFSENFSSILGDVKCLSNALDKVHIAILDRAITMEQKMNVVEELNLQFECIIQLYELMGQNEQGIGLDIKIPETDDITEFKEYIDDLEFIFSQCFIFRSDNASIKLRGVDIGSIWLAFSIIGAEASALLNNIATFVNKCFLIREYRLACEGLKQEIEKSEYDQNKKEEIIENIKEGYKSVVSNALRDLGKNIEDYKLESDNRKILEQSLEKLEKLIDKGLQIYASIDSPPETKALFKPLEIHYLSIAEELKRIEKKSDDEDEE